MHQQANPYNLIFERRRLKCAEIQRTRRQQIFNKSRQLLGPEPIGHQTQQQQSFQVDPPSSHKQPSNEDTMLSEKIQKISINKQDQVLLKEQKAGDKPGAKKSSGSRRYARLLQVPSWMNNVPELLEEFYVMARPSGKSCILVFEWGWFSVFDKVGKRVYLPAGKNPSPATAAATKKWCQSMQGTILEGIYCYERKTMYLLDLICWKGTIMTAQNFQFRYAWLLSNLANAPNMRLLEATLQLVEYRLLSSRVQLEYAYLKDYGYVKQGLYFVHKQSAYCHGLNQNALIWKDEQTSLYPSDQNSNDKHEMASEEAQYIYGVARLTRDGAVRTLDGFELSRVNSVPQEFPFGCFVRFRLTAVEFGQGQEQREGQIREETEAGKISVRLPGFQIVQHNVPNRVKPDTFSRIVFQHRVRHDPLTIRQIASRLHA